MKNKLIVITALVMIFGFVGCATDQYAQSEKRHFNTIDSLRVMKIQDVTALTKAGLSDSLIIGMMDATDSWFQLKTQDVLDLRNAGVSERVINAMMQQPPEQSNKAKDSNMNRYYVYPSPFWYGGFYPGWYAPSFSIRMGYYHRVPIFPHHRRIR